MNFLNIISGPLIGGIIGYFTNYIAIKMLFRPINPVKIGKLTLPFTPGIVPKRKDSLAETLGDAIVTKFFTYDDLEVIFLSDYMKNAVVDSIVELLYSTSDENSLANMTKNIKNTDAMNQMMTKIKSEMCIRIQAGFLKTNIEDIIVKESKHMVRKNFQGTMVSKLLNEDFIATLSEPLSEQIKEYVLKHGRKIILPMLEDEFNELFKHPVGSIIEEMELDESITREIICDIYAEFMKERTRSIVEHIDVSGIIKQKVIDMSPLEIEELTLSVVKRELHAVVMLGAIIGVVIGIVNIFI